MQAMTIQAMTIQAITIQAIDIQAITIYAIDMAGQCVCRRGIRQRFQRIARQHRARLGLQATRPDHNYIGHNNV